MRLRQSESVKNLLRKPPMAGRPSTNHNAEAVSLRFNRNLLRQRVQCAAHEMPQAKKLLPPYKPIESLPAVVRTAMIFKSPKMREGIESSLKKSGALSPTRSIITLHEDHSQISLRQHTPSLQ